MPDETVMRDLFDRWERVVRPLIMAFYGPVWLLAGWGEIEMRRGFRAFRLDRRHYFG